MNRKKMSNTEGGVPQTSEHLFPSLTGRLFLPEPRRQQQLSMQSQIMVTMEDGIPILQVMSFLNRIKDAQ